MGIYSKLYNGTKKITSLQINNAQIKRVYYGTHVVYASNSTTTFQTTATANTSTTKTTTSNVPAYRKYYTPNYGTYTASTDIKASQTTCVNNTNKVSVSTRAVTSTVTDYYVYRGTATGYSDYTKSGSTTSYTRTWSGELAVNVVLSMSNTVTIRHTRTYGTKSSSAGAKGTMSYTMYRSWDRSLQVPFLNEENGTVTITDYASVTTSSYYTKSNTTVSVSSGGSVQTTTISTSTYLI